MKVLHITPSFFPATHWGGPIWSTKAICDGIAARPGFELRVLSTDAASPALRDRVAPVRLPYPVTCTRRLAGHAIAPGLLARLPAAVAWADVVHLTATYNMPTLPTLMLARLLDKPLVWSPRGALQGTAEWEDAPRRATKRMFARVANLIRPRDTVLHVTAPSEAAASIRQLAGVRSVEISNAVDMPPVVDREPSANTRCRLLFLGRLHPKKGLAYLFDAMERLPSGFVLDIFGTGDADYVAKLRKSAKRLNGRVTLHGHVGGAAKAMAFARADLFVLPSHSENFGIAVAEALAHGLPVITTTDTPWQDVERVGCGRCIDLDHDDLTSTITQLAQMDLPAMGARGRAWMARDFSPAAMVDAFADLYTELCHGAPAQVPA
ncbi:glycosyltransferase [Loktanella sp. Alg231-35]|uniref:glycosyltransferase n=1 Tax=Loktanella sp. Alg231-35 TaxID=1922220 RepID=UPI000D55DA3D|nr:glycosyltransferase [Loktanella sp. Alg231-35]